MTVDRRTFLKRGGASASLFLISASGLFAADGSRPDYLLEDGDTITEKKRRIPVTRSADVVVCGGGPSGFGAAVQAARTGAKVVLVEHAGCLGGTWTSGCLGVLLDHRNKKGILKELKDELERRNWRANDVPTAHLFMFDPEKMKLLLDEMCGKENIDILLYTSVVGSVLKNGRITHIVTESKSGREAISGKAFIDATGDGDLAAMSGCGYDWGNENGETQPMSMLGLVTGIDFDSVKDCVQWDGVKNRTAKRNLISEIRRGGYEATYKMPCLFYLRESVFALMAVHQYGYKSIDRDDLTRASIEGRREVHTVADALKSLGGRWGGIQVVSTAAHIGCREGRRIHGLYQVTEQDLIEGRRHSDAVCEVEFGVDVHPVSEANDFTGTSYQRGIKSKPYDIPLRSLIAKDVDGLMMVGRCICGDFIAHSSYRVNSNSVMLGQSAGYVAAKAVQTGRHFTDIAFHYIDLVTQIK